MTNSHDFPMYSQRAQPWAGDLLGNSLSETVAQVGCLLTDFSMLARIPPREMNICMREHRGFQREPKGSWAATFDVSKCAPDVRMVWVSGKYEKVEVPPKPMKRILDHLRTGEPAIIQVDFSPRPGQQQHWVFAHGVTDKGEILINDPWPHPDDPQPVTLTPQYGKTNEIAIIRAVLYEVGG